MAGALNLQGRHQAKCKPGLAHATCLDRTSPRRPSRCARQNPATWNRTRDHLITAMFYSQMLCQLSYSRLKPFTSLGPLGRRHTHTHTKPLRRPSLHRLQRPHPLHFRPARSYESTARQYLRAGRERKPSQHCPLACARTWGCPSCTACKKYSFICCAAQSCLASCIFHCHRGMKSHADATPSIIIAVQVRSFFAETEPRESL